MKFTLNKKRHDLAGRPKRFARLLLLVFVPMWLMSAVHVHPVSEIAPYCDDCAHHVSHAGHITAATVHNFECLLCQFLSLAFVAAATIKLFHVVKGHRVSSLPCPKPVVTSRALPLLRAPPRACLFR